jgi:hypothetical protein
VNAGPCHVTTTMSPSRPAPPGYSSPASNPTRPYVVTTKATGGEIEVTVTAGASPCRTGAGGVLAPVS